MKRALLALAFLPNLVFAGPITFTVDVNARDPYRALPPIVGQVKFTFDDTKQRVVNDDGTAGIGVSYLDQAPFISPLPMPTDSMYGVGARIRRVFGSYAGFVIGASGGMTKIDDNGNVSEYVMFISGEFFPAVAPSLDASSIVQYFKNSEKLTFTAYAISYNNYPQPASNFITKYYYLDQNAKLVSVIEEAEVPEPATLASLMLGLGLIGFMRLSAPNKFRRHVEGLNDRASCGTRSG